MAYTTRQKLIFAERMRKHPTLGEARVWQILQGFRPKWRRQWLLCGYIVDFYEPRTKRVLEVDGSIHATPDQMAYDATRNQVLAEAGYTVLHVGNRVSGKELHRLLQIPRQQPDRRQSGRKRHRRGARPDGWVLSPAHKALKVRRALDAAGLSPDVPADGQVTARRKKWRRVGERRSAP